MIIFTLYRFNNKESERKWTIIADSTLKTCINNKIRNDIVQAVITDYLYLELGKENDYFGHLGGVSECRIGNDTNNEGNFDE